MEVLVALGILIGLPLLFILPYWAIMSLEDWTDSPHLDAMEKWNILNLMYLPYKTIMSIDFKPKSELDREISDEEKEIEFLTEQKAKIDRLENLKRKKDRLYQEINSGAQTADTSDTWHCPHCGSTKVTGSSRIYRTDLYNHVTTIEHCADCGTPTNDRERVK